jgi:hypothetical protein
MDFSRLVALSKRSRRAQVQRSSFDVAPIAALLEAPQPGLQRGSDFVLNAPAIEYINGPARIVDARGAMEPRAGCDPLALSHLAATVADFFGKSEPFTVVLALVARPKKLAYARPLQMSDINGGATYHDQRLIILWRLDPDLDKVLLHELTHLLGNEWGFKGGSAPLAMVEALTEATALCMWCALHDVPLEDQVAHTARLAVKVALTNHSATNAWAYTGGALAALTGKSVQHGHGSAPWRPDEEFRSTVITVD